jgi:hypothetical protein
MTDQTARQRAIHAANMQWAAHLKRTAQKAAQDADKASLAASQAHDRVNTLRAALAAAHANLQSSIAAAITTQDISNNAKLNAIDARTDYHTFMDSIK